MLAVVLAGLKWFGIVLLVVAGLFLLVCLSILLVPVCYRLQVMVDGQRQMRGSVSWLFHLVHVSFQSGEEGSASCIRIFGIPLDLFRNRGRRTRGSRRKGRKKHADSALAEAKQAAAPEQPEGTAEESAAQGKPKGKAEESAARGKPREKPKDKAEESAARGKPKGTAEENTGGEHASGFISRFFGRIRDFVLSIRTILGKIKSLGKMAADENTPELFWLVWGNAGRLLRHIRPSGIKGWIRFGTSDPCLTGQILGGISLLFSVWGKGVTVIPDFEETVLEGDVKLFGRVRLVVLLIILFRLHPLKQWNHYKAYMNYEE